jgi:hypothetical protein
VFANNNTTIFQSFINFGMAGLSFVITELFISGLEGIVLEFNTGAFSSKSSNFLGVAELFSSSNFVFLVHCSKHMDSTITLDLGLNLTSSFRVVAGLFILGLSSLLLFMAPMSGKGGLFV